MKSRIVTAAVAAMMAAWLGACSQETQDAAKADAETAADQVGEAASEAGDAVEGAATEAAEAAGKAGEAVEGAVNDAAKTVDRATDDNEATHP